MGIDWKPHQSNAIEMAIVQEWQRQSPSTTSSATIDVGWLLVFMSKRTHMREWVRWSAKKVIQCTVERDDNDAKSRNIPSIYHKHWQSRRYGWVEFNCKGVILMVRRSQLHSVHNVSMWYKAHLARTCYSKQIETQKKNCWQTERASEWNSPNQKPKTTKFNSIQLILNG